MALKFRRGTTADKSGSLSFGEPYVNTTLGTLQIGGATGDITLLINSSSQGISGSSLDITGNAKIDGNLILGGNITIGDQTSDIVAVNANLSSSIIPSITNTFDLGSETRAWRDLYISTGSIKIVNPGTNTVVGTLTSNASGDFKVSGELSGSTIAGLGNAQQYSASINSKVDALQSATQSINQSFHQFSGSINTYTASNDSTNITQNSRLGALETESGSVRSAFNSYTASNDSTNTTQNSRLGSLETTSGSLVSFSASVANGIQLTGSNVTIKGDLVVKGTTTTIDSTTVQIGDNIIELNGSGAANAGIVVRDVDGTTNSGSLVWDSTADYWKAGVLGSEQKIVLDGVFSGFSSSINAHTASANGRLGSLETESGSIRSNFNTYTSSADSVNNAQNARLNSLEGVSGSYATTGSNRFIGTQTITGSLVTSGSKVEFNVAWPSAPGEQHIIKTNAFTIDSRSYEYAGFALDHYEDAPGTYHNAMVMYMYDDGETPTYGSEILVGPYRSHLKTYISGAAGIDDANVSVQDLGNGTSQALIYADTIQLGVYNGDVIEIGNNNSSIRITGSAIVVDAPITTNDKILAASLTGSIDYTNLTNVPTLVSGSSQILGGSGIYSSSAQIQGNIYSAGSSITIQDLLVGAGTTFGKITTDGSKYISVMPTFNVESARFWANGNVTIQDAGTYVDNGYRLEVSGSTKVTDITAAGFVSGEIRANNGVVSGSSQVNADSITNFDSNVKDKLNVEGVFSGSAQVSISDTTGYNSFSSSISASIADVSSSNAVTDLSQNNRLATIESRYATTGSNNFFGNQYITGSLIVSDNLQVLGSSSIVYSTASQLIVEDNIIVVNASFPAERFAGLEVHDSGSNGSVTASILWDGQNNRWIYQNSSEAHYGGAMFIAGPRNTGSLGDEQTLTNHRIPKSIGGDHIGDSIIHEYTGSNTIGISGSLTVTGSISASGGINGNSSTTTKWATARTITLGGDLSGNVSIDGTSDVTLTATIGANSVALGTDTSGDYVGSLVAGTGITLSNNSGEGATPTIALTNNAITIAGNSTSLGGSISAATILSGTGVFSGSAQITTLPSVDTDDLVEGVTNLYYLDSRVKTKLNTEGVISGSSQVFSNVSGDITIASNGVATIAANSVALGTDTTGNYVASLVAGTNITLSNNSGEGATPTIGLTNNAITIAGTSTSLGGSITAATILSGTNVVSGSSQITLSSVTGYVANEHVNHANVSISAGSGISGGGDITATRTITLDTGSAHFIAGSRGTNSAGTGISYSSGVIANTGVTSNVAGTGISVSGATGAVTITNTGVTSAVAGTGVTVSGATGAVTFSIGQAVATTSEVQFAKVGVGGASDATYELKVTGDIGATGDIVAYISSDKRFKDNVIEITDSLDKVRKIRGVKWDWNNNASEAAKKSPNVGVIAQEVQQVLPEIVHEREDGYLAVDYTKMAALFIEAIKEQQIQIENLRLEVEDLKKQKGL